MNLRKALTLVELLVLIAILLIAVVTLAYAMSRNRSESWRRTCANNLNQLARGMATYISECGDTHIELWSFDQNDPKHGVGKGDLICLRN